MEAKVNDIEKSYFDRYYQEWEGYENDLKEGLEYLKSRNEKPFFLKKKSCVTFPKDYSFGGQDFILFIGIPCVELMDKEIIVDKLYINKYGANMDIFKK